MIKNNKKGLSGIISNTILILLSLVTISLVYIAIILIIEKTTEEIMLSPLECLKQQNTPQISLQNACYNSTNKELEITLQRKNNQEVKNLEFIIQTSKGTEIFGCGDCCKGCEILTQGDKTYYISQEEKPNSVSLEILKCEIKNLEVNEC